MSKVTKDTSTTVEAVDTVAFKFSPYDTQLPLPAVKGMRYIKCMYKENKKTGKKAGENSYISIPDTHLSESILVEQAARLAPYVAVYLASVEDKLIKAAHLTGTIGFNASYLSLDKILAHLDDEGQGNRLNKEVIEEWFNAKVADKLSVVFAGKLGLDLDTATAAELMSILAACDSYKAKFASLASGKTVYQLAEVELLQKCLHLVDCGEASGDNLGMKFWVRLESMKNASTNSALLAL